MRKLLLAPAFGAGTVVGLFLAFAWLWLPDAMWHKLVRHVTRRWA